MVWRLPTQHHSLPLFSKSISLCLLRLQKININMLRQLSSTASRQCGHSSSHCTTASSSSSSAVSNLFSLPSSLPSSASPSPGMLSAFVRSRIGNSGGSRYNICTNVNVRLVHQRCECCSIGLIATICTVKAC